MSPNQYRALERLHAAGVDGMLVARGPNVPPGRIHPRTADALERRNLATLSPYHRGETVATITLAGVELLDRNPATPRPTP